MNTEVSDTGSEPTHEKCGWTKFSESKLIEVEKKILNVLKTAYKTWFVPIESTIGKNDKIWTILLNEESRNTPLVLLHGFAAGLCFWCLNFDTVAKERPVYAIDLLGFGRSSRPNFSSDCLEAEQQMVESLEEWRKQVKLDKFILLGHSFGGYLATSYALNYPNRVKHLVLADPWGFTERPAKLNVPIWFKVLGILFYPLTYLNPLATVRAAGPIGPWLIGKVRNDLSQKYGSIIDEKETITEYIYHCNSQKPTGEAAFHSMRQGFAWAKNPMIHRLDKLSEDIPLTLLYGEDSWIRQMTEEQLKNIRPQSYIKIEIISSAGHHINADQPKLFNEAVINVCQLTDSAEDLNEERVRQGANEEDNNDQESKNKIIEPFLDEEHKIENMQISNHKI